MHVLSVSTTSKIISVLVTGYWLAGVSNIRPAGENPACQAFQSDPRSLRACTRPILSTDTVQHEKYSELVARLIDDVQQRFEDFRKSTDIMKL